MILTGVCVLVLLVRLLSIVLCVHWAMQTPPTVLLCIYYYLFHSSGSYQGSLILPVVPEFGSVFTSYLMFQFYPDCVFFPYEVW